MNDPFQYELLHVDARSGARRGRLHTPHGTIELPTFMPVGTLGTVKGVEVGLLQETGAQIVLGNTYHLTLRPGEDVVQALGGLHEFMGWPGPILTDSGGFQLFSLAQMTKVSEEGAVFRSHIDGRLLNLTPERSVAIQETLGSDIAMVLDHVISLPNDNSAIRDAMERSIRWARRCKDAATRSDQALLAIIQGGLDPKMRRTCAESLAEIGFPGYAVGGLSVGETPEQMYATLDAVSPAMPKDRPRYLMGVGRPQDLLEAIRRGIDMFDCVMPTRNGRNASAFTDRGPVRLRNEKFRLDPEPLDACCPCPACRRSKGYIRHLFQSNEMLGPILLSLHNLTYYQRLMHATRLAIEEDRFLAFYCEKMAGWGE